MKPMIYRHSRFSHRTGFTLTEIAIVLGVIGVVIGAVWGAAAAAAYRAQINRASDDLHTISNNMFALYAGRNVSVLAAGLTPSPLPVPATAGNDFCKYTPTAANQALVTQGIFPPDMLTSSATPPRYTNNPWSLALAGCGGTVGSAQVSLACPAGGCAGQSVQFAVRYTALPLNVCAQLLIRNSVPGVDTRLKQIVVTSGSGGGAVKTIFTDAGTKTGGTCATGNNSTTTACLMPISSTDANTACNAGAGALTIDWYFQLGG